MMAIQMASWNSPHKFETLNAKLWLRHFFLFVYLHAGQFDFHNEVCMIKVLLHILMYELNTKEKYIMPSHRTENFFNVLIQMITHQPHFNLLIHLFDKLHQDLTQQQFHAKFPIYNKDTPKRTSCCYFIKYILHHNISFCYNSTEPHPQALYDTSAFVT